MLSFGVARGFRRVALSKLMLVASLRPVIFCLSSS
jgi:hypothetical protein